MIIPISLDNFHEIREPGFRSYARRYAEIENNAIHAIESYGLDFQKDYSASEQLRESFKEQLAARGASISNNGHSIHANWLSEACVACRTGKGSYTTFASLKCHRDCYFCFNPNQEHYAFYQNHTRDLCQEASAILESDTRISHVALTGGEPLLHKAATVAFFAEINRRHPSTHTRLYTSGDHFGKTVAAELQRSGLKEIRFSLKIDDAFDRQSRILDRLALAKGYIPRVMVEMPIIPGSLEIMERLFDEFDRIGLDGVNLLEFCFPLTNARAFKERELLLKYPPYETFYNYWYAGGVAIAGSEELCLQLMLYALEKGLGLGMHYCALENKHTGQIYQQNENIVIDSFMHRSLRDFFIKTAKIFGKRQIQSTKSILEENGRPFRIDEQLDYIEFHPEAINDLEDTRQEVCLSYFVAEQDEANEPMLVEVKLNKTTPGIFSYSDI